MIFHSLANKGELYLFNHTPKNKIKNLFNTFSKNKIEYLICIPSQYLKILQMNRSLPSLRCISLTGENLPRSLCELHTKLAPHALLYNEYGPSEYAIGSTIAKIYDPEDQIFKRYSVGKPLPHTQIYILDEGLEKVSEGIKGEIYIGGIGLAKGYLNNVDLTSEKFISVSFSGGKTLLLFIAQVILAAYCRMVTWNF